MLKWRLQLLIYARRAPSGATRDIVQDDICHQVARISRTTGTVACYDVSRRVAPVSPYTTPQDLQSNTIVTPNTPTSAMSVRERRLLAHSEQEQIQQKFNHIVHRQNSLIDLMERQSYQTFLNVPLVPGDEQLYPQPTVTPFQYSKQVTVDTSRHTPIYADENGQIIQWPWDKENIANASSPPRYHPRQSRARLYDVARSGAYDLIINEALDLASADGNRGRNNTGTRAWFAFCHDKGITPDRPMEPFAPLQHKLLEEWLCMEFVTALVTERGVAVATSRAYFSQAQGWHAREHGIKLCGGLKLERLPQMLKGLRRKLGDTGNQRPQRRAISPKQMREALDHFYDPNVPLHANIRAAITCAYAGLMRSAEFCGTTGKNMILRADVVHFIPKRELVVMMHPVKNMVHLEGKTCPLLLGAGGKYIDPVAEYANLREVDAVPCSELQLTPLFRDPATNAPLSYDLINEACKRMGAWLGFPSNECTSHILRISGATAIFAAGGSELMIRTMGRWSSDLHRLYVRCCFEQCRTWCSKLGSVEFTAASPVIDEVDDY